jgi:hypothetical protein
MKHFKLNFNFKDLNEKDFKMDKTDSKLYLVLYTVKNIKSNQFSASKITAGGGISLFSLSLSLSSLFIIFQ